MERPNIKDYQTSNFNNSMISYTKDLEKYCDWLEENFHQNPFQGTVEQFRNPTYNFLKQ